MASMENPYEKANLGDGVRSKCFDSFAESFDNNINPDIAKALALDTFLKMGIDKDFAQIVDDVWDEHFAEVWSNVTLVSMEEDDDTIDEDIPNLIPQGEYYLKHDKNVLLIGPHGTGKTYSIMALVAKMGLKMAYYSCSTLDPYTDLVGVPVPNMDTKNLEMIRPHAIDECEFIFFDEFNRADSQTVNAIFEIIQFRTINGEPLPNLKCCWAAMNPADGDYTVSETDPALLDRFHAYIKMEPAPSTAYLAKSCGHVKVAKAVVRWWTMHETKQKNMKLKKERMSYVSPRRLEMICDTWVETHSGPAVMRCLPPNGEYDHTKLIDMLETASGLKDKDAVNKAKSLGFPMEKGFITNNQELIGKTIKEDVPAQVEVINCLFKGTGPHYIREKYDGFINQYCVAAAVETVINGLNPSKRSSIKSEYAAYASDLKDKSLIFRALSIG